MYMREKLPAVSGVISNSADNTLCVDDLEMLEKE